MTLTPEHQKAMIALDGCDEVRVLRRFRPRHAYGIVNEPKVGLFVDVETTGLDTDVDKVIQFAGVRFEFDTEGNVGHVGPTYAALEDPGAPLSADVVDITGITDEQLRGQKIDDAKVAELLDDVVLVIAHNADFDRRMIERRFTGFDARYWACSQRDVKWEKFGCRGLKLDYLLVMLCGEFYDAHDALADCLAGVHVLTTPRAEGKSPFQALVESVRTTTYRVFAKNSPFPTKTQLRLRHYKWLPDPVRCWVKDVKADEVDVERAWLQENVYGPGRIDHSEVKKISSLDHYSIRA